MISRQVTQAFEDSSRVKSRVSNTYDWLLAQSEANEEEVKSARVPLANIKNDKEPTPRQEKEQTSQLESESNSESDEVFSRRSPLSFTTPEELRRWRNLINRDSHHSVALCPGPQRDRSSVTSQ